MTVLIAHLLLDCGLRYTGRCPGSSILGFVFRLGVLDQNYESRYLFWVQDLGFFYRVLNPQLKIEDEVCLNRLNDSV